MFKILVTTFSLGILLGICFFAEAQQTPLGITVQVQATAQTSPPSVTLHWPQDPNAIQYSIYRKSKNATGWTTNLGMATSADSTFTDLTVQVGEAWEYRIIKTASGYNGQGYCFVGIEKPAQDYYGKLLLVVDTTFAAGLSSELTRLENDLWGDGWQVVRINVDRNDSVPNVKTRIQNEWLADPTRVRSVFLLGHVPVPYAGDLNPDAHPDHKGAWPADVYYAEMNGAWTDQTVNNSSAARQQNRNVPGDGKFDNSIIPGDVELEVGRVDFANMPAFSVGEEALLRRYLEKDHAWRMKQFSVADSGVVDDNFGYFGGESFATSGWRNMAPLVGSENAYAGDFRTELNAHDRLWAYACGGGWYQGASGVGSSTDFAGDSLRAVFTMIFGSYHGDWDSDDNFMRASLATKGHILSCAWAGRPNWHFQHMGVGEPIGNSARVTQNNFSLYPTGYSGRNVHIALMGDPSVRLHVCAPPSNLTIQLSNSGNAHELNWTASPDQVLGYAIFRQDTIGGRYWRIGQVGMNSTTYADSCMLSGTYRYMVRAEELRMGPSGSYFNLSQGLMDSIVNASAYTATPNVISPQVFCAGDSISVPFTTVTDFCSGNTFSVELSDSNGNFGNPVTIGAENAFSSGTITCLIPSNTIPAIGYRMRIVSTHPATIGNDNGADLEVLGLPVANFTYSQSNWTLHFTTSSAGATVYSWNFGDGDSSNLNSPQHTFASGGTYTIQLISSNACGNDTVETTTTFVGMEEAASKTFEISPNPAGNWVKINRIGSLEGSATINVSDMLGHLMFSQTMVASAIRIDTEHWPRGIYIVEISQRNLSSRSRLILE
jgi:PKD repeat protein